MNTLMEVVHEVAMGICLVIVTVGIGGALAFLALG